MHGEASQVLGYASCSIGDQDSDDVPDIAISAPDGNFIRWIPLDPVTPMGGRIMIFPVPLLRRSRNCPPERHTIHSAWTWSQSPTSMATAGGCRCDYEAEPVSVRQSGGHDIPRQDALAVYRYSTREVQGHALEAIPDQNGDGMPEFVVGSPAYFTSHNQPMAGHIAVLSMNGTITRKRFRSSFRRRIISSTRTAIRLKSKRSA